VCSGLGLTLVQQAHLSPSGDEYIGIFTAQLPGSGASVNSGALLLF
jgi:hypothetical protein